MTETLEFNSACYYRYIGLNLDLLKDEDHLHHLTENELLNIIDAFLRASITAVPEARKNSMFGHNPPAYVLGFQRSGQPLSLVNAFEAPVRSSRGYVEESKQRLNSHWENLANTYCLKNDVTAEAAIPDLNIDDFINKLTKGVD